MEQRRDAPPVTIAAVQEIPRAQEHGLRITHADGPEPIEVKLVDVLDLIAGAAERLSRRLVEVDLGDRLQEAVEYQSTVGPPVRLRSARAPRTEAVRPVASARLAACVSSTVHAGTKACRSNQDLAVQPLLLRRCLVQPVQSKDTHPA